MKKILLTLAIMLSISTASFGQDYSPLKKGIKKSFQMQKGSYTVEVLDETVVVEGKEYFQMVTKYSWGKEVTIKLRIDSLGNELYLDTKSNMESINFPANPKKGMRWESTDGAWKYEIVEVGKKFKTPNKKYKGCLVIMATQVTGRDTEKRSVYYNYYAKDIGYVGSETPQGLMSWMIKYEEGSK